MKGFTDINQSKILSKILSVTSADMCWQYQKDRWVGEPIYKDFPQFEYEIDKRDISCWSLAALYSVLPTFTIDSSDDKHFRMHCCKMFTEWHDNPIDCCVEMILKIKEKYL